MNIFLFSLLLVLGDLSWAYSTKYVNTLSPSFPFHTKIENTNFGGVKIDYHDGKELLSDSASGTQVFTRSNWAYSFQFTEKLNDRTLVGIQFGPWDLLPIIPFNINLTGQYDLLKYPEFKVSIGALWGGFLLSSVRYGYGTMASYQPLDVFNMFFGVQRVRERKNNYLDNETATCDCDFSVVSDITYDIYLAGLEFGNFENLAKELSFVLQLGEYVPKKIKNENYDKDSIKYSIDRGIWTSVELRVKL